LSTSLGEKFLDRAVHTKHYRVMDNPQDTEETLAQEQGQKPDPLKDPLRSKSLLFGAAAIALVFAVALVLFQLQGTAPKESAQEPITIGVLRYLPVHDAIVDGLKQGLAEAGYEEGQDVVYTVSEVGFTEEKTRALAKELIAQDVDLIFALASVSAKVAVEETAVANRTDIPIVMSHALNTINLGIIDSYQSSGNNLTGIEVNFQELTGKKLEFLKRLAPQAKKIGVFDVIHEPGTALNLIKAQLAIEAPRLGLEIVWYPIETEEAGPQLTQELQQALAAIAPGDIDAYLHNGATLLGHEDDKQLIIDRINELKIPSVWVTPVEVRSGGLMTYQYDLLEMGRQSAVQVEKVLSGIQPAGIPIEFAQTQKLFMNFSTVEELGITVPEDVLELVDVSVE